MYVSMHMIHMDTEQNLQGEEYTNADKHGYTCEIKTQRHCGVLTSVDRDMEAKEITMIVTEMTTPTKTTIMMVLRTKMSMVMSIMR